MTTRGHVFLLINLGPLESEVAGGLVDAGLSVEVFDDTSAIYSDRLAGGGAVLLTPTQNIEAVRAMVLERSLPSQTVMALCADASAEDLEAARLLADDAVAWPEVRDHLPERLEALAQRKALCREALVRRRIARAIAEIAATLAGSVEFEDLLHDVLIRLTEHAAASRTQVMVIGRDEQYYYQMGSSDDPTAVKLPVKASGFPEVKASTTDLKEIFMRRSGDPGHAAILEERGIAALWVLPLPWMGEAYGVLELSFDEEATLDLPTRDLMDAARCLIATSLHASDVFRSVLEQTKIRDRTGMDSRRKKEMVKKYDDFFKRAFDGIFVLDRDHSVLHINPAGEQITGYARPGLVGTTLMDIVEEGDEEMLRSILSAMEQEGVAHGFDLRLITTSGDTILVSVSPSAVLEEDEVLVLSFRDVTEARALETELRSTKDFLERLIDSAADAIIATDINEQMVLFNKGAEQLFSMQSSDVVGNLYMEDLFPPGMAAQVMEQLRGPEEGGIGRLQVVRKEVLDDNQERVPVSLSANLVYENGQEVGTVGIMSDLRSRLRIEQRLAQAQEKLVITEKQALIAELAGTTAHELNQPLTSVMGYAELLKRRLVDVDGNHRAIDTIIREAERMAEIVRKIGKITRYETKAYVGATQILDLEKSSEE